jgi:pimeloyl-ACP methyl ester carboxylesterase
MILNSTQAGTGAHIVLLHGLFGRLQNLGTLARRLAAHGRVISIDIRNHGASPHAAWMDYRTLAGDVLETLTALNVTQAALLGHSMGGKTAMATALMAPDRVSRLLVADIAPVAYAHHNAPVAAAMQAMKLVPGMTRGDADRALLRAVPDATVRGFQLQNFLPGAAPGWRIGLNEIAAAVGDLEGWPVWPPGTTYEGPALFISGGKSDYVLPQHEAAITALFPAAVRAVLPEAGHWLHADAAEEFAAQAERFLFVDRSG